MLEAVGISPFTGQTLTFGLGRTLKKKTGLPVKGVKNGGFTGKKNGFFFLTGVTPGGVFLRGGFFKKKTFKKKTF